MAPSADEIESKVTHWLHLKRIAADFFNNQKSLLEHGILSAEQLDRHHDMVRHVYRVWLAGVKPQHDGDHLPQPMGPQTPESIYSQAPPPKTSAGSPPQDAPAATVLDMLKEAADNIDPSWPLQDAAITSLLLPGDPNHRSAAVSRKETSRAWSCIQARALEKHKIKWKGDTVNLQWKSGAITPDWDQSVQTTCFFVVDKAVANQAGFHLDMLVGADHGRPLLEQMQALGAEETDSSGSSEIDHTEDLSARSFSDSHSIELRPSPDAHYSPPPSDYVSFSGSSEGVAKFIRKLQASGDGMSKVMGNPAVRLNESHNPGRSKRKLSHGEDSGGPSRKNRSTRK